MPFGNAAAPDALALRRASRPRDGLPCRESPPKGPIPGRGVAQPGSASHWGCGGRWFESSRPDHFIRESCDGRWLPAAAEGLEQIDLVVRNLRVGGRERRLRVGEGAFGVEQLERIDRALPLLEAAAKGPGLRHPSAYVELARQRLAAAQAKAPNGQIDDAQRASVMEPLLIARRIPVPLPATYVLITEAWLASATPPKLENYAVIGEGRRLFPRELPLIYALARLYKQNGEPAAATKLCQVGLHFSTSQEDRDAFEQLLAALTPPAIDPASTGK